MAQPARAGRAADQLLRHGGRAGRRATSTRRRSATASSCGSRSAWSGPSRRGTTRCTRSRPRSPTPSAAGCTVVLKPSEVAPLDAFILAEIIHDVGLPAGVFNLVSGTGPVVGEAIAEHPEVDMVSFTGSTRAGRRVAAAALGHRSSGWPSSSAASPPTSCSTTSTTPTSTRRSRDGVGKAYLNSGQTCSALTRMLVPPARLAEAERDRRPTRSRRTDQPATRSPTAPASARSSSQAQGDRVHGLHPEGHRRGRHARHRRPRQARGPRATATTSSPRSSPTSPTT